MDYMTQLYKNKSIQLQEQINLLEAQLKHLAEEVPTRTGLDLRHVSDRAPTTNVDTILDRISRYGKGNLTPQETTALARASYVRKSTVGRNVAEPTSSKAPAKATSKPVQPKPASPSTVDQPKTVIDKGLGAVKTGAKTVAAQFPTNIAQYPAKTGQLISDTVKGLNPVKKVPGGIGPNYSGLRNLGGFGAGYAAMKGTDIAMDAMGIKNEWARTPTSWAAGAVADTAVSTALGGALPTAGALGGAALSGAGAGLAAVAGYKAGEAISNMELPFQDKDKRATVADVTGKGLYYAARTPFNWMAGNDLGAGTSDLNTPPTGKKGGEPAINIKNAAEDKEEEERLAKAKAIEAKTRKMSGKSDVPTPEGTKEYDDKNLPDEFFSSPEEAAAYRAQRAA